MTRAGLCLLSQCLERLKTTGQSCLSSSELKRIKTDCQNGSPNKFRGRITRPLIYAFLKPQKSFNPSADFSFSLILIRKVAEGFCFQTLQSLQPTLQPEGNVNHREWTANVRKYLYGGDGALGEQASCLLCLLIHRCQTDFKQISVLHLSDICGQTGGGGALGEQEVVFFIIGT